MLGRWVSPGWRPFRFDVRRRAGDEMSRWMVWTQYKGKGCLFFF